ncbi:hypothetical protein Tco_0877529 [Tanacetum coccineum]|uniref:Uncharacterized protein n=1 Tax=Tanacetum coccineum TaxID=301880 RepID=A0ABQ5BYJ2_9ASTR
MGTWCADMELGVLLELGGGWDCMGLGVCDETAASKQAVGGIVCDLFVSAHGEFLGKRGCVRPSSDLDTGSCTRAREVMIFCTIKSKPLALPWGRTPRLDSGVREPRVLMTCRSRLGQQMELLGDETYIVSLYYHIVDIFQIQFGREKSCLVTGLRFGVEYWADYNNKDDPIPFRRQVFSSAKDGILQFVLLGLEDRRGAPDWILRMQNVRRWPSLYATEPRRDVDKKTYSIFGFTWEFKTWILESFRVGANDYNKRHRRYPRIVARSSKRKFYRHMIRGFFHVSSRAYFDGRISEAERVPRHVNRQNHYEVPSELYREIEEQKRAVDQMLKKEAEREEMYEQMRKFMQDISVGSVRQGLIIVNQHYGLSDLSVFQSMQGGPSFFPTQGNHSFFEGAQMPSRSATPNWQTPMPSHPHDAGLFNPNILNRAKRKSRPSMYRRTPYMDLPPTTVLPKKRGDKTKNKGKNSNVSPLNLGNAFADDNVGEDDVMIMAERETGNYFMYENVDPSKVRREDYIDCKEFLLNPYDVYLDCHMMGYMVPDYFRQQLVPHLCMHGSHSLKRANQ